tara:strand:+ start:41 stop:283 length:243 start_codon:yes stop_codon:yes gene_type:complete
MTQKEILLKSLAWRFFISIPATFYMNYIFLENIYDSLILTFVGTLIGFVLYYLYELLWFKLFRGCLGFDKVLKEKSAGSL